MQKRHKLQGFLKVVEKIKLPKVAGERTVSVMMIKLPQEVLAE